MLFAYTKNISISTDILWRVFHILTEPVPYTFVSVDRRNNEAQAHVAITGLGAVPPVGPGAEPLVRGQSPLKLNTFLCCHMPEMAQSCYVYELFLWSLMIATGSASTGCANKKQSPRKNAVFQSW